MKCGLITTFGLSFISIFAMAGKPVLENIQLQWKATTDLKEIVAADLGSLTGKVKIVKFRDARTVKPLNKIGENTENADKGEKLEVTTISDVAGFVTDNLSDVLKKSGLEVVTTDEQFELTGELTDFFVTEVNTYQANMMVKLTLSKAGKAIWQSKVVGTNKRFGRSYKLDNYLESFSDVIIDFAVNLAKNAEFKAKLK